MKQSNFKVKKLCLQNFKVVLNKVNSAQRGTSEKLLRKELYGNTNIEKVDDKSYMIKLHC